MTETLTGSGMRIIIRKLRLDMLIGIYPHERQTPQRVLVSIEAAMPVRPPGAADSIETTVSYEDICNGVKQLAAAGHIGLVETFAERIAALCLSYPQVQTARILVEKPDIIAEADSVGVEIVVTRDATPLPE